MEAPVARFFHPPLLMLAGLGKSEPARHVRRLKAENEILCQKRLGGWVGHCYRKAT